MAGKRWPWFKFFPMDWLADPELQSCSPAARGVWMDILSISYNCPEPGVLRGRDGKPWGDSKIVSSVRGDPVMVLSALNELVSSGVARRADDGALYSKRMVQDCGERKSDAEYEQKRPKNPPRMNPECSQNDAILDKSSTSTSVSTSDLASVSSERGSGGKPTPPTIEIPASLDTPDFRAAWDEWLAYRRERKLGKPTGMTIKATYRRFEADMGPERAAAAIRHSIEKGWHSINEPKEFTNGSTNGINRGAAGSSQRRGEFAEPPFDPSLVGSGRRATAG